MQLRQWFAIWLLVVAAATQLTGCASAVKAAPGVGLEATIGSLAAGGVAVMDDFRSTAPSVALAGTPSAMRFTRWQLSNLVAEANAHAGYLGSELDTIAQPPPGAPPLSTLIGAWLTRKDGALAIYAAGLMGTSDYKQAATLVFPTLVVLTFIGDIARTVTPVSDVPHADMERFFAAPAEADGICTDIAGWVGNVVNNVTAAVQVNGSGWLASIWNTVVSVAGTVVTVLINGIAQTLLGFITKIATICGTLMQVSAMFKPWSVSLTANPATLKLAASPDTGEFVATLDATDIPWPASLVDCVQALSNVNLKDASYKDAPVTWTPVSTTPGLATKTSADATLLANKTAAYHFVTKIGPDGGSCPRTVPAGTVGVQVSIARSDVAKTLAALETLITNQINASIRTYLAPYINLALDKANAYAHELAAPHETVVIPVSEDIADSPCSQTPPPATSVTAPATGTIGNATMPDGSCTGVLTAGDAGALHGDVVFDPVDEHGNTIEVGKMFGQLMDGSALSTHSMASGTMPHGTDYDTSASSWCTIGKPPSTVEAFFAVIPRGTLPYRRVADLRAADARGPQPCHTQIGYDLLDAFDADCRNTTAGLALVTVFGPKVEYIIGAPPGSVSATALTAVITHILQRSR